MGQTIKYNGTTVELSGNLKVPGNITNGSTSISVANIASKTHTHGISIAETSESAAVTLSFGSTYKLTAGGASINVALPTVVAGAGNAGNDIY